MANQLCRRLSNSYRFFEVDGQLKYQPCCWVPYSRSIRDKSDLDKAREEMSKLIESNFERTCRECIGRERSGYRTSARIDANKLIPEDAIDGEAYILEYQINTNCNAACSICNEKFSSLWAGKTKNFDNQYKVMFDVMSFDRVERINFFGGEPLLGNDHIDILQRIPNPNIVTLCYSTNGSIAPNAEILNFWKQFKQINLTFSIDAINERFEYIRWPLLFKKVETNIKSFLDLPNVVASIHCTVNPMNLLYIGELEHWSASIGAPINYGPCHGTWGLIHAPTKVRECAHNMLSKDHPAIKMLSEFPYCGSVKPLIQNMDQLDSSRHLNWKAVFPKTTILLS